MDHDDRPGAIGAVGSTGAASPHPVLVALAAVDAGVAELAAANVRSMSDGGLLTARVDVEATRGRLDGAVLAMTREIGGAPGLHPAQMGRPRPGPPTGLTTDHHPPHLTAASTRVRQDSRRRPRRPV